MCGISGIIFRRTPVEGDLVRAMCDQLTHRGPDSSGIWVDAAKQIGLGHRRLAIVDLTASGHQPMVDSDTGCVLTFNGEIYNHLELRETLAGKGHAFRGHSDTEVLLAAYKEWGVVCPQYLNGMFAFAIWDPRERCLFAARDRAGEKPFYYAHDNRGFRFGSELKALMADPEFERRVDADSLHFYFALGYVPAPRSIFQGVSKLEPAHALTYRVAGGKLTVWRYWKVPLGNSRKVGSGVDDVESYTDELGKLLEDSVRRQMIADVPVGVLLSGGIDSSLVAAVASRVSSRPVKTFTITFPGHGRFDESVYAAQIARHFGTEHHEFEVQPASFDLLPKLAEQFDEPMVDSSMIPTFLVCQLIRQQAKVALGGDGGDELFGGYSIYGRLEMLHSLNKMTLLPRGVKEKLLGFLTRNYLSGARGRNYLVALSAIIAGKLPNARRLFSERDIASLLTPEQRQKMRDPSPPDQVGECYNNPAESYVYRLCRADFSGYLVEDILTKVDRASMLNSLEVRAPWLDHRIIEFAFGCVPDRLKTRGNQRKVLPKLLARRLFPPGYDYQRKQGFSLPLSAWLKMGGSEALYEIVRESPLPMMNEKEVERQFAAGNRDTANPENLFAVALLSLWARRYRVSF